MIRVPLCLLALGLLQCAPASSAPEGVGEHTEAVAVPGPWNPPEGVRRAAAAQYVDVVDPPNVSPHGSCPGSDPFATCTHPACTRAHPGTSELDRYIRERWSYVLPYGTYNCRRNSNNLSKLSVHAIGRAIDAGIPLTGSRDADNTLGDAVANWLIANAAYIGIQRVGWDGMWWNGERGFIPMSGDPHKNHLHIEMSIDGSLRRTRFFTEGPPAETCPIVCYGTAAVAEDCSYVDCAASGQVCMSDPVRCETAGPPEPPESRFEPGAAGPTLSTIGPPTRFQFLGPTRVFDTRAPADSSALVRSDGSGERLDATRTGTVSSWPGLPSGADGVWVNAATVNGAEPGFLSVHATGPMPPTSTVNYNLVGARSNAAPVAFTTGTGVVFDTTGAVDVIGDLVGAFVQDGAGFRVAGPLRVDDSRSIDGPVAAETEYAVDVRAPAGATGVVATVAVIADAPGFITAYACGSGMPDVSSVNVGPGVTAGAVVSRLSADGRVCFWSSSDVELVVDVTGYWTPDGALDYQGLDPARLLDTREESARYVGRLADNQVVEIPVQSLAGAPANIHGVVVNLTTLDTDDHGFVTVYPCGFDPPLTSSLNYGSADRPVVGSVALSTLGEDGSICVTSLRRTHLIVDLLGVFVPNADRPDPPLPEPPEPPNPEEPMEMPDGGVPGSDGGDPLDGGPSSGVDTGALAPIDSGCGCRTTGAGDALPFALLLGALLFRRRRIGA